MTPEIENPKPPEPPAEETQVSAEPAAKAKKAPRTPGEKAFDWATYGAIGGVANFLVSLQSGYSARYGKIAPTIERWTQSMQKSGLSRSTSENVVMTTALMMGGNLMLIPIKWLENRRGKIVGHLNDSAGCEPVDAATSSPLPKQTWSSLIKGRLVAWGMVFASFKSAVSILGPKKFEAFEHDVAKNLICDPLAHPTHVAGQETKLYRYGRIAALDVFASAAAATLLYFGSRFFARHDTHAESPAPQTQEPAIENEIEPGCKKCFSDKAPRRHETRVEQLVQQRALETPAPTLTP